MSDLDDARAILKKIDQGYWLQDCFTDIYIAVSGQDVKPHAGYIGKRARLATNPIFPSSAALIVEDVLERAFRKIVVNQERWKRIHRLMNSDELAAVIAFIDLLFEATGGLPIATVAALLVKIGAKRAFAIGPDGPKFDRSLFGKLSSRVLGTQSCDEFDLNLYAARLHRMAGNGDLCRERLLRCRAICRLRDDRANLNSVGYEYIELGDLGRGMTLLEEALSATPDDPGLIDSIAWAKYKAGRFEEAAKLIRQVLERESDVVRDYTEEGLKEALYHAVTILRSVGDSHMASSLHVRLKTLDRSQRWIPLLEMEEGDDAD